MKLISSFLLFAFPAIVSAQNVGIGIANPTRAKLEVNGAAGATSAIFGGESSGISLQRNFPSIGFNQYYSSKSKFMSPGYAANFYLHPATGTMGLDMLGSGSADGDTYALFRAFTIANNGNMSIKTQQTTGSSLYVSRTGATEATAAFAGNQHKSYFNYGLEESTYIRAGVDYGTVFINDIPGSKIVMSGLVGINTGTPTSALEIRQVNNKGITLVEPNFFGTWQFNITSSSLAPYLNLYHNGTYVGYFKSDGSYNTVSDSRLKKDVRALPEMMQKLMQLKPVGYEMKYNNPTGERTNGFLAQELKSVFPELVTVVKDTATGYSDINDLHTVNYTGLTPVIIKGMQEQQQLIQSQQKQIDKLEKALEALTGSSKIAAVK